MLRSVYINNIALIKSQTLEFCDGFNVLSGETGAGKSIIVDSLMLILGNKFDRILLRYGENMCRVEAEFDTTEKAREYLLSADIEPDDVTVISRKMTADGKTENRINGRAVTLSHIKTLGAMLLDICGQNEYQFLGHVPNHIKVLDTFNKDDLSQSFSIYDDSIRALKEIQDKLDEIKDMEDRAENIEFLKRKLFEIEKVNFFDGELEELEAKRKVLQSAGKIATMLDAAYENLSADKKSAIYGIESAIKSLGSLDSYGKEYSDLSQRLNSVLIELEDIAETVDDLSSRLGVGDSDIDEVEDRLHKIKELVRKYGDFTAVQKKKEELKEKIDFLENADELYDELVEQKNKLIDKAYSAACKISQSRRAAAETFEKSVMAQLNDLGMEKAVFKVVFSQLPTLEQAIGAFTSKGLDSVEFYLAPNAGQPLKPLTKIISGGEQSRLMLALKMISGDADEIPSLIFDEIDTGISGKIGLEVAKKLANLSVNHQILCVTHLPQIAAMADKNYLISKNTENDVTLTNVSELDAEGVVDEIARLSGAKDISSQASVAATEMKQWSDDYKRSLI